MGNRRRLSMAYFATEGCEACPLVNKCPSQRGKRDPRRRLRFTQAEAQTAAKRRLSWEEKQTGRNLRAAAEATMRSVKHPFPAGKLPVRGQFRVTCLLIGSAAVANIRRIQRYLADPDLHDKKERQNQGKSTENRQKTTPNVALDYFLFFVRTDFKRQISLHRFVGTWICC
jgi:hypothetical protein